MTFASNRPPAPQTRTLHATPAQLSNIYSAAPILITGLRGALKVHVDPVYLDVSKIVRDGSSAAFMVTKVAGGVTAVMILDAGGERVTVPVINLPCTPPAPSFSLLGEDIAYPVQGPPGVQLPTTPTYVFLYTPFNYGGSYGNYSMRLLGSDGPVIRAGALTPVSQLDRSVIVPVAPKSGTGMIYFGETNSLPHSTSFRVEVVGQPCEPPIIVGSFSTE